MADTQIHPTGTEAAPADYVIPKAVDLRLKGAYAVFDGSGAAGGFKPLLRIISDAGTVALEAVADEEVAAGGSAEVSWFPGVRGAAAGSTTGLPSCVCALDVGTGVFPVGTSSLPVAALSTTSPTIFSTPGGGSPLVTIAQDGFYLVSAYLSLNPAVEIDDFVGLFVTQDDALGWSSNIAVVPNDATHTSLVSFLSGVTFASMFAGDFIAAGITANAGLSNAVAAGLSIVQLNPLALH